jgi:D-alanyl-D-alanine carboxypeptidase
MRQGRRLVAVTINAPDDWNDHSRLMESGFQNFSLKQLVTTGDFLGIAEVAGGESPDVGLYAAESFCYPVAKDERIEIVLQGKGFVYAPVVEGQSAGFAYICIDGNAVGKVGVIYADTIEQYKSRRSFWDKLFGGKDS